MSTTATQAASSRAAFLNQYRVHREILDRGFSQFKQKLKVLDPYSLCSARSSFQELAPFRKEFDADFKQIEQAVRIVIFAIDNFLKSQQISSGNFHKKLVQTAINHQKQLDSLRSDFAFTMAPDESDKESESSDEDIEMEPETMNDGIKQFVAFQLVLRKTVEEGITLKRKADLLQRTLNFSQLLQPLIDKEDLSDEEELLYFHYNKLLKKITLKIELLPTFRLQHICDQLNAKLEALLQKAKSIRRKALSTRKAEIGVPSGFSDPNFKTWAKAAMKSAKISKPSLAYFEKRLLSCKKEAERIFDVEWSEILADEDFSQIPESIAYEKEILFKTLNKIKKVHFETFSSPKSKGEKRKEEENAGSQDESPLKKRKLEGR